MTIRNLFFVVLLSVSSANAQAATATTTFLVSATVLDLCVVTATPLAFGNYDSGAGTNATNLVTVTCTLGTSYDVGLDAGLGSGADTTTRKMSLLAGTDTLNYKLYQDASRTVNWGNAVGTDTVSSTGTGLVENITVYGNIPASQNVTVGTYNDTITVTVTY